MGRVESYTQEYLDQQLSSISTQLAQMATTLGGKATPADIQAALAGLIGTAPQALDTLGEIADAFQDNPQIITEILTAIGLRVTTTTYDTHVADTAAHGATSNPTASTIVRRDTAGKVRGVLPTTSDAADSLTTRSYVDPRVGRFMGDYVTGTQFYPGDVVLNAGRFYRSLAFSATTTAPVHTSSAGNTAQWVLLATSLPVPSTALQVVEAGTNLANARPAGAIVVYWKFSVGVNVGTNGANVVNGLPGDQYFVATS